MTYPNPETAPPASLQALIDAAPLSAIQARVVLLCTLVTLAEGIDLNLIPLLAPSIARSWSLPSSAFALIFSAGPIGLIIGGFTIGRLADRFGRRLALIAAVMLMTIPTFATAWTRTVAELALCRILTGVGFGGVVPAAATLVSEFVPTRRRASVVAFVILGQSVGGLVTALLIKTPLGSLGWQTLVLYMAGVCAALAGLLVFALPESPRYLLLRQPKGLSTLDILRRLKLADTPTAAAEYSEPAHRGAFKALFADGRAIGTLLLWATFIGVCAVVSFFTSWLPLLYTYAGHDAAAGVSASAAYWTGGIVSGIVLPLFALRWHVDRVLLIASLGAAVACAGLGAVLSSGPAANLALAFACGIFISGAFYLLYPPAVHFYPTEIRSTGIGAAVAFGRLGNMLSPAAAGLLLGWGTTPTGIFLAMALLPALSVVAVAAFHRHTQSTQL